MHRMVLVVEEAQVEARLGLFGYSAHLDARWLHSLPATYHMLRNQFGRTQWNSKMTCVICNLASVCLETMLVSVQDRCIVCA